METMELNLNEMETISSGTDWDHIVSKTEWKDLIDALVFGSMGDVKPLEKLIAEIDLARTDQSSSSPAQGMRSTVLCSAGREA